jgi:H+/Cl- antiporter ClcA
MAQLSYWIVHEFCIQAAGSGIPEATAILGGFVVKYYLTARALIIKTVALVYLLLCCPYRCP